MLHRNRCLMWPEPLAEEYWGNLQHAQSFTRFCCCLGEHTLLSPINTWKYSLYVHVVFDRVNAFNIPLESFAGNSTFCQFHHLHAVLFARLFFFFFSTRTSSLGLRVLPFPHFLLFHLVWLWGLGCRDNGGHRHLSILFAKFLLLQTYCTLAAGIV